MSQLYIQGRVVHEAGPWGEHQPVTGARVEILSGDEEQRGSDLIMLATTDTKGEFQGLTTEWRGTVLKTIPDPEKPWKTIQVEEPDADERLVLRARIRQTTPTGVRVVTRSVQYSDDITPIPTLTVNWGPPERSAIGSINGNACNTPMEFLERTMIEINARRADIKLEAFGQAGEPYLELTAPTARQQRLAVAMHLNAEDILRIRTLLTCNEADESCDVMDNFWISLVLSSIIFAPVTGQAAAAFGLALQRLLQSGYKILSVGNSSVALNGMGVAIRLANPQLKASQPAQGIE